MGQAHNSHNTFERGRPDSGKFDKKQQQQTYLPNAGHSNSLKVSDPSLAYQVGFVGDKNTPHKGGSADINPHDHHIGTISDYTVQTQFESNSDPLIRKSRSSDLLFEMTAKEFNTTSTNLAFASTATHRGLINRAGENNCFLNATIQVSNEICWLYCFNSTTFVTVFHSFFQLILYK